MPSLINWNQCKKLILDRAADRAHKFNRVGKDVKNYLEASIRTDILMIVAHHPSKGKTIKMGETHGQHKADTIDQ